MLVTSSNLDFFSIQAISEFQALMLEEGHRWGYATVAMLEATMFLLLLHRSGFSPRLY